MSEYMCTRKITRSRIRSESRCDSTLTVEELHSLKEFCDRVKVKLYTTNVDEEGNETPRSIFSRINHFLADGLTFEKMIPMVSCLFLPSMRALPTGDDSVKVTTHLEDDRRRVLSLL